MPALSSGRQRKRRPVSEINVVPYIDVMLVLLVIFMVTAPMLPPGQIDVPSAGQSNAPPESLVEIRLQADGQMRLVTRNMPKQFDRAIGKRDLAPVLRELADPGTLAVLIAADQKIPYGEVVEVMNMVRAAGAPRVGLMVKGPGS
jgi:biopolymer transport protein TolR